MNTQGGNAVYGLGLVGALIFFIGKGATLSGIVIGILKALVWPAFFVYYAFDFFLQ